MARRLPAELIQDILVQAWGDEETLILPGFTKETTREILDLESQEARARRRWQFYESICRLSRDWHRANVDIPLREVILSCDFDVLVYPQLLKRRMEIDMAEGIHISPQDYLNRARMMIDFRFAFAFSRSFHHERGESAKRFFGQSMPNSRSVALWLPAPSQFYHVMQSISQFPSLSSIVTIHGPGLLGSDSLEVSTPATSITRLLVHFLGPVHIPLSHWESRKGRETIALFPNATDITLSHDFSLIEFVPQFPKLKRLTLHCYPLYTLFGQAGRGTLRHWRIVPALRAGLLQGKREGLSDKRGKSGKSAGRLVINTGHEEPDGWTDVANACVRHGVVLERRCVFTTPSRLPSIKSPRDGPISLHLFTFRQLKPFSLCATPVTQSLHAMLMLPADMPSLPAELIRGILTQAWIGDEPLLSLCEEWDVEEWEVEERARVRWEFYDAICLLSRDWRQANIDLPLRELVISCNLDLEMYTQLLRSRIERDVAKGIHDHPRHYLDRARMIFDFRYVLNVNPRDPAEGEFLKEFLTESMPNSRSVALLFPRLDHFQDAFFPHSFSLMPNITRLLVHFLGPVADPLTSWQSAQARETIAMYPNATDITLSRDMSLIEFVPQFPKLQRLTLQCYPLYTLFGRPGMGTLRYWRIIPALAAGLLQGGIGGLRQSEKRTGRLIINTGHEEPDGWADVAKACARHGVPLERRCIFTNTEQAINDFPCGFITIINLGVLCIADKVSLAFRHAMIRVGKVNLPRGVDVSDLDMIAM
ncbi:hypothetical protein JAAARDRAFT_80406 [Jaapia argillacea MUCL 33604]|uniref:Uncharacterized protein n=1 Tax=Jaapia argillacea MUCL 33604 TaxID=933084 RepID=A0A067PGM2_9AGAM|nr:hypothetical protein JAAARDRAFT_80406 [Jaapia argillacea MUCL 33604]